MTIPISVRSAAADDILQNVDGVEIGCCFRALFPVPSLHEDRTILDATFVICITCIGLIKAFDRGADYESLHLLFIF